MRGCLCVCLFGLFLFGAAFDRGQVRKLGQGHFGVVFEGEAAGIVPGEQSTRVAVKVC